MVTVVGSGNRRTGTTGYEGEGEEGEEDPDPGRGGGGGGPFTAAATQTTTSVRLSPSTQPPPNRRRKRPNSNGGGVTFADLYMDMMDELRPNPAMVRFRLREVFAGDGDLERGEDEENRQLVFRIEFE